MLFALPVAVISIATCVFGSILVVGTSISMILEPPRRMANGSLPAMTVEFGPMAFEISTAGSWASGVVVLGIWLGIVHAHRPWRGAIGWLVVVFVGLLGLVRTAVWLEGLEAAGVVESAGADSRRFDSLAIGGLILAAVLVAVPVMLLARLSATREGVRRTRRMFRRARRRRDALDRGAWSARAVEALSMPVAEGPR